MVRLLLLVDRLGDERDRDEVDKSVEYVQCQICKSPDTLLGKENRLYYVTCESCGSRESSPLSFYLAPVSEVES